MTFILFHAMILILFVREPIEKNKWAYTDMYLLLYSYDFYNNCDRLWYYVFDKPLNFESHDY